ncbi:hypothetical protein [Streptomyces albospinus]|uniref:hypothetical protein n=1 Tax=Streptomyces albospinus TaxID=285515 RepID=UPI001670D732|nr:hypothetical protein [Streptomyces albospinus]
MGGTMMYRDAASRSCADRPMGKASTAVSPALVATVEQDTVGVLSATAPGTVIESAMKNGFTSEQAWP